MTRVPKTTNMTRERGTTFTLSPVSNAVRPIIKRFLPQKSVLFQQLFDIWPDLVNGTEAVLSTPEKLALPRGQDKNGVLHIWATTGAQATEMTFNKANLIRRINTVFGYTLVSDIYVTAFPTTLTNKVKSMTKPRSKDSLSCQSLDKAVTDISNPSLRSVLVDLGSVLHSSHPETTKED